MPDLLPKVHDVNVIDIMPFEAGSFYLLDRGYMDYNRLYIINLFGAFYVTRAKSNSQLKRRYSAPVSKEEWDQGVRSDQTVVLTSNISKKDYPIPLRRVRFIDLEKKKRFTFLTNNFEITAIQCAHLLRADGQ